MAQRFHTASVCCGHGVAKRGSVAWAPSRRLGGHNGRTSRGKRALFLLESVREVYEGLQTLRSIRRIEANRRNARALSVRFSKFLARRRQRLSHARVRSTTQRIDSTTLLRSLDDLYRKVSQAVRHGIGKLRCLVTSIGKQLGQKRMHPISGKGSVRLRDASSHTSSLIQRPPAGAGSTPLDDQVD